MGDDAMNEAEPPLACTLSVDDLPERLGAWRVLLEQAERRESIHGGERFVFAAAGGLAARMAELCALEQLCCSFFTFRLELTAGRVTLDVTAPEDGRVLVTTLIQEALSHS